MAVRSLRFVLTGEDKSASRALDKVGKKADGLGSKLGKLSALSGAALGAGAVVFAKNSLQAYADAEKAQSALALAYKKTPKLIDVTLKSLQNYNSELAKKTVYDDDAIASGQTVLTNFNLTGKQLKKLTPLLLDYATRTGKDLPTAATDLGRAVQGNTKSLKAIGIRYKATGDQAKDFDAITAALAKQVGGFAENEGKTASGQVRILKNRFGELQETVGEQLLPVVSSLVKWLNDKGVPALQHFADEFKNGEGAGGALRDTLVEFKDAAATAADVANKTIVPVIRWFADHPDALKGVVGAMVVYKAAVTVAAAQTKSLAIWSALVKPVPPGAGVPPVVGFNPATVAVTAGAAAIYGTNKYAHDHPKGFTGAAMKNNPVWKKVFGSSPKPNRAPTGPAANPRLSPNRHPEGPVRHRARGGNIEAGLRYMVGEDGPEWITPRWPGYVTPHKMAFNPRARLDTSQFRDTRRSAERLFMTPTAPRSRTAYAPAGMRDYITNHTVITLDGKKFGTAATRRTNARVSRGHLPPGLI